MNLERFFDAIRARVDLTDENVSGFEKVLEYAQKRGTPLNHLAYVLATALWETNFRMQPVTEAYWLSEAWRRRNLRYYPWHGRGLIQTTWKRNYARMGKEIGVDLLDEPDRLLKWEYSLPALFIGMEKGLYTGKKLDDYIDDVDESDAEDLREFRNARKIVNGTDKANTIGKLGLLFERALKAASYQEPLVKESAAPLLRRGDKGDKVRELQSLLKAKGQVIEVDGDFGPRTESVLRIWQTEHFDPLGVVGEKTWKLLKGE